MCDAQVLLGKRANEPLKGEWFTPGGRIHEMKLGRTHFGAIHSLENTENIELELTEVQSGDYLGEYDIVRYNDVYGRV